MSDWQNFETLLVSQRLDGLEGFRHVAEELYDNITERGGHPNINCVLMIKILVLQQWY
jgi:hypothetical protein